MATDVVETLSTNGDSLQAQETTLDDLNNEIVPVLVRKGYSRSPKLITTALSALPLTVLLMYPKGKTGTWTDLSNRPMVLSKVEGDILETTMRRLPMVKDFVIARYFWVRAAVMDAIGHTRYKSSTEFVNANPHLIVLIAEACFLREAVREGARFHGASAKTNYTDSEVDREASKIYGLEVAREFAERLPNVSELT